MTYAGARGATADEMATALRFSLPPARLHPAFGGVIRAINPPGARRAAELHTANALWSQTGAPFKRDFRQTAQESYAAALEELDFRRAPETARRTINAWVEQQTRERIKDLIREGVLTPATTLVLTNAVYFKSAWQTPFREDLTRPDTFALGTGGAVQNVPMMFQVDHYPYLEDDAFRAVALPYKAGELSLIVFLPRAVDSLAQFEKTITAARVAGWLAQMRDRRIQVFLPRFKVTAEFQLQQPLQALGMKRAFSAGADFSGMIKAGGVFVDAVVHKAQVDVNERGTEAAAATAVPTAMSMPGTSAPIIPSCSSSVRTAPAACCSRAAWPIRWPGDGGPRPGTSRR
jgi:serpin B